MTQTTSLVLIIIIFKDGIIVNFINRNSKSE